MEYRGTTLPNQKVSLGSKNQNWRETSLDAILSRSKLGGSKYHRQQIAYNIMDSDFDLEDLKYVTNPYKVNEGFPAKMQNVNIIAPKIRLLLGEESKRPQSHVVFRTGEAASESVVNLQKDLILEAVTAEVMSQADSQERAEELQAKLQEAQAYVKGKYYSPEEKAADNTLKYLKHKLDLDDTFLRGFEDGLISNDEIYYVGIINGEPYVERVNPLSFSYDRSPDLKGIEEGDWAVRQMEMSSSEIHDRYYDLMDESTFDEILAYINEGSTAPQQLTGSNINTDYIRWRDVSEFSARNYNENERRGYTTVVYHGVWRSYKKIGYLYYTDENGVEQMDMVDETYKPDANERIEWDWIDEVWQGYRVGRDIFFGIEPLQYQDYSVEEPKNLMLPYVGGWYNGNNTVGKSLVEMMKPLQYFYLILFYRLELTLARDRGKVLTMDITQIPASMGIDENKWLHYLTSMGVNFVNPYEEGWDIPGREGGKASQFNQISAVDLTMSNVINEYIALMNKVEEMIGELSGISEARQGQIHQSSLVGNVRQEITQSSHITEVLFWRHNKIKNSVYRLLLDVAKFAWRRSDRQYISYVLDGPERAFINLSDDFLYSDYDVFVSDTTKEHQDIEQLRQLYQPAMQNGASLLDIASIMTSTSMSDIKTKLSEIEAQRAEAMNQQSQMEAELAQAEQELKARELQIKEEDSIRQSETSIQVALINQAGNEQPIEDNSMELEKLNLQKDKQNQDFELKKRQIEETERSNRAKESIAKSKPKTTTK